MNWVVKDLKNCKKEYKTLVSSTPIGDDYMREGVILSKKRRNNNYFAVCLYNNKKLIGWSMLDFFLSKHSSSVRTYIYVKTKYRRKKFGTKILEKAKKIAQTKFGKKIKVIPHDKNSLTFFKATKIAKEEIVRGYKY